MSLEERVLEHLRELTRYPDRHVGGEANRQATSYFAETVASAGFDVSRRRFECIDWVRGGAALELQSGEGAAESFAVHPGPYSLPFAGSAPFVSASSVQEIEAVTERGALLFLHGDVTRSQLIPKNFRYYSPESHRRILAAIEAAAPAAVIAATGRNPEMAGGGYPFPLFEDGDFDIPNAYMTDVDGERLLALASREDVRIHLAIDSGRAVSSAEQVSASLPGALPGRIVITAHIDSREGSPGALDNASGVAVLLGVAELLSGDEAAAGKRPTVELVPFNGEDNYASPGEIVWFDDNEGRLGDILLAVNIDDLGMKGTLNHVSFYGCDAETQAAVRGLLGRRPHFAEGPQWFQSDHSIFAMKGRPALALASSGMVEFMTKYAHTEGDVIELADERLIAEAAVFVLDVVHNLGETAAGKA
ncbi:MAG: M28 family metallopeptidase [Coriobacteriia bacterium]